MIYCNQSEDQTTLKACLKAAFFCARAGLSLKPLCSLVNIALTLYFWPRSVFMLGKCKDQRITINIVSKLNISVMLCIATARLVNYTSRVYM